MSADTIVFLFLCCVSFGIATSCEVDHIGHQANTALLHLHDASTPRTFHGNADLKRTFPSSRYLSLTGRSQADIAAKLNLYAAEHTSVLRVVPCSDLTSSEVASIAQKLKLLVDDGITMLLPEADGRHVYADPEMVSVFDSPRMHKLQCAETMKLWAHHIPTSVKNNISAEITLPEVPIFNQKEVLAELLDQNRTLSCVTGHTVVDLETLGNEDQDFGLTDWPHWPARFTFRAKAFGPYPFWQFGKAWQVDTPWIVKKTFTDLYSGADMEAWHSSAKRATTFYHSNCEWDFLGYEEVGNTPCIAIQTGIYDTNNNPEESKGKWFVFTANSSTRSSDGVFCCYSTLEDEGNRNLGTINRKFMDNMKYMGNVDFHGKFYDGVAKQYVMALDTNADQASLPLEVWYETDMDGKPLRFAEIGTGNNTRFFTSKNLLSMDFPYIYEEFDPTSLSNSFSDTVFDIPEMCNEENLPTCVPGPNNRNGLM